jgi:GDP-L-fucose synthase
VDDLADACLFLMNSYESEELINVGVGEDLSIKELANLVQGIVGYGGRIEFDTSKPDGTPRKLLDVSRVRALGWAPRISLADGIADVYRWFLQAGAAIRTGTAS